MNQCICLDITEILLCHVFSNTFSLPAAAPSVVSAKWRSSFRKRTSGTINIKRRTKGSCAKGSTITCNHMDGREAAAHVRRNINKRRKGKRQTWVLFFRFETQRIKVCLERWKKCQLPCLPSTVNHCIPDQRPLFRLRDTNPAAIRKGHAQMLSRSAQFNGSKT